MLNLALFVRNWSKRNHKVKLRSRLRRFSSHLQSQTPLRSASITSLGKELKYEGPVKTLDLNIYVKKKLCDLDHYLFAVTRLACGESDDDSDEESGWVVFKNDQNSVLSAISVYS